MDMTNYVPLHPGDYARYARKNLEVQLERVTKKLHRNDTNIHNEGLFELQTILSNQVHRLKEFENQYKS